MRRIHGIEWIRWGIFALGLLAADADASNYNDRYGQQIGGTLHIHWELVSGPTGSPVGCTGIEFTDGTLADAADGAVSMSGTGVSIGGCLGTDSYTFTMAPDGLSLNGFAGSVPMTLTRLPQEAAFVGDWVGSGYTYRAHIAADPFPVPGFNPQFEGEWIGWFQRAPGQEKGTARLLINDASLDGGEWAFDSLFEWGCLFGEECSASEVGIGSVSATGAVQITGTELVASTNWTQGVYVGQLSENRRTLSGTFEGGTWSVTRVSAFAVPAEVATIQGGVDQFADRPGLRIEIAPGTYAENIDLSALSSNPGAVDIAGLGSADQVIIDDGQATAGDAIVQTLGAGSQYPLQLRNLTISGGFIEASSTEQGGAGLRVNGGTRHLIVKSCDIRDNRLVNSASPSAIGAGASVFSGARARFDSSSIRDNISVPGPLQGAQTFLGIGGGIGTNGADVRLVNSSISANEAAAGGGIVSYASTLRIVDSEVVGNNPDGSGLFGGGLFAATQSEVDIIGSTFRGNAVRKVDSFAGAGGGISSSESNLRLVDAVFESNTAEASGGGMSITGGTVQITGGRFGGPGGLGNLATNTDDFRGASGGAISNGNALSFIIKGTHFEGNISETQGGAIAFSSSSSGRFLLIEGATFLSNQSTFGGAIISSLTSGSITVIDSDFEDNLATGSGGALFQFTTGSGTNPIAVINNSRFFRNRTLGTAGAAIGIDYAPFLFQIIGSSIVDNRAEGADAIGAGVAVYGGTLDLSNSILWANTGTAGDVESQQIARNSAATIVARHGIVQGFDPLTSTLGPGPLSGDDPLFAAASTGNLRLLFGSPAVDAGDASFIPAYQMLDLDGNPRVIGAEVDLGVYEYTYSAAPSLTSVTPNSGPVAGGTPVTISGSDFQAGASARFGDALCTDAVVTVPDTITCNTPFGSPVPVNVTVTNPDGQFATLVNGYTYISPAPTISSITPNSGPAAGGTSVTISGSGFLAGAITRFGDGALCTDAAVAVPDTITCNTPFASPVSVNVTVTNPDGQFAVLVNGYQYTREPTSATIHVSGNPVRVGESVRFDAEVVGTSAPSDGQVTFTASSGESCTDGTPQVNGTSASFSCQISFESLGPREASAVFSNSITHLDSSSTPLNLSVARFADLSVSISDGQNTVKPGQALSYLIEVRNAGPDDAPGSVLVLASTPQLAATDWICSAVGLAQCPAASGAGELGEEINLPADGGLDFIQNGVATAQLVDQLIVNVTVAASAAAPNFVVDSDGANNQASDVNTLERIFTNGFE